MATIRSIIRSKLSKETVKLLECNSLTGQSSTKCKPLPRCFRVSASTNTLPSMNPVLDIQKFTKEKLIADKDNIFAPTKEEVAEAEKLFISQKRHEIKFLQGAYYAEQAPDYNLPEVAFIGRSNVGKSSLIKAIFANVDNLEVRVSGKPGHTKLLLFYQCGKSFSLVDMPGYGVNQPENFVISAEGYLSTRKNLHLAFLLVDSNVGLQPTDFVAIEMLEEFSKPYVMVMTKADKASRRHLVTSLVTIVKTIKEKTQCCLPQPFLVSAHTGLGLSFLKCFIAYTTSCIDVKGS